MYRCTLIKTFQVKRYAAGNHIAIFDIPGVSQDKEGIYVDMKDVENVLEGKIKDEGSVSI